MKTRKHTLIRNLVCILIRSYRFRTNPKNVEQIVLMEQHRLMIGFTWIFCILLAFTSCKTVKESTKNAVKVETTANVDVKKTTDSISNSKNDVVVIDKSTTTDDVAEIVTTTDWSKPDSVSGKQYAEKTTVTERVKRSKKVSDLSTKDKSENKEQYTVTLKDQSDYKSDSTATSIINKQSKTRTPAWLSLGVLVLIGGLLFIVYLVLKRYKVLK